MSLPKRLIWRSSLDEEMSPLSEMLYDGVRYLCSSSIYDVNETIEDLTTAQTVVLNIFYGILFTDIQFCKKLLRIQIKQTQSSYLKIWFRDDFNFDRHDVEVVFSMMSYLLDKKTIVFDDHIYKIFSDLVSKYDIKDCCSYELLVKLGYKISVWKSKVEKCPLSETSLPQVYICRWMSKECAIEPERRHDFEDTRTKEFIKSPFDENEIEQIIADDIFPEETEENTRDFETEKSAFETEVFGGKPDVAEITDSSDFSSCEKSPIDVFHQENNYNFSPPKRRTKRLSAIKEETAKYYEVVDDKGRTILHRLSQFGRAETVKKTLEDGADIDVQDKRNKTPLHWAAMNDHWETVQVLLENGANVNARTSDGRTALSFISSFQKMPSKTWSLLVGNGATV